MRRALMAGILAIGAMASSTGCFLNMYSADPVRRYRQLMYQSEDLRALEDEMERFWMIDHPSQMTLKRQFGLGDAAARSRF